MKLNKLLALGVVLASGLTLTSCNKVESVEAGVGYSVSLKDTNGQADVTVAFAGFDAEGKITAARLDVVQVTVAPDAEGAWTHTGTKTNDNGIASKLELGKDYNMLGASPIGKEVDVQIEAFADWTVGKTVAEVKELTKDQVYKQAPHADLASTCTITVSAFVEALEKAYELKNTAVEVSPKALAGVGITTKFAAKDTHGELTVFTAGTLMDGETIQAAAIDEIVLRIEKVEDTYQFQADDYYYQNGKVVSKESLKDAYGMTVAHPTKGEWYVQAAAIETYSIGKTAASLLAEVGENGKPVEGSGLIGATTMTANGYVAAIAEAASYASLEHVGPQA